MAKTLRASRSTKLASFDRSPKVSVGIFNRSAAFILARKRFFGALFLILLLSIFILSRTVFKKNAQPQYQTAKAQKSTVVSAVTASGQVLTTNVVNVTTSASGVVKDVFVADGQSVRAGDKIAEITLDGQSQQQSTQASASYLAAKTNLDAANANAYSLRSAKDTAWKKFYDLSTSSTYQNPDGTPNDSIRNSSAVFQSAQGDWLAAEAKYKNQQAVIVQTQVDVGSRWLAYQLSSPTITAPIAGTISNLGIVSGLTLGGSGSSVSVGTGGSVQASQNGQRVAVIQNQGTPIATFNVSEIDISRIKIGQKATVKLDAVGGKTFTGKVVTADHIGTVSSGVTNYTVLISFDVGSQEILPNMATSASIIVDTRNNVLAVPTAAVQTQGGQSTVRVLRGGQPQQVPVETGLSSDSQIEITSGLSEGDEVVTSTSSTTNTGTTQQQGTSPFGIRPGGGFGGLRPGGGGGGGGANRPAGD